MKGLYVLVHTFAKVRATVPDAVLIIAGRSGPATEEIEEIIAEHGFGSDARLIGYRDDVADLMCGADVFALPSRTEGSPGALIESMALEVPTVASDIPSVREVAGHDPPTAELCVPGSADDLARGIIALIEDPERAAQLTRAGRARFEHRYAMNAVADATVALYERCLTRPR